ncbi:hypothetical protein AB7Z32_14595 [Bradyrhizobium sp. 482_C4_N1_1]|uniref:hypothetical protein n=1 Tax=unclassified Bradyrhizobium TaxID=2631580 RepID=UPI00339AB8F9
MDALQPVRARVPADQLRRDLRPKSHVDDPHDTAFVGTKTQDVIEVLIGAFSWRIPFRIWKRLERRRRCQPRHTNVGTEEWMVTEDQLIVRRKRNVADRLRELRKDFRVAASVLRTGRARDDCRRQKNDKSNSSPHASHRSLPLFSTVIPARVRPVRAGNRRRI